MKFMVSTIIALIVLTLMSGLGALVVYIISEVATLFGMMAAAVTICLFIIIASATLVYIVTKDDE